MITFSDSLTCQEDSYFLYTSIKFNNTSSFTSAAAIQIVTPNGWKVLGSSSLDLKSTKPHSFIFPITLVRSRVASAYWSRVGIIVFDSLRACILDTFFHIKGPIINDFQVLGEKTELELSDSALSTSVAIHVKNLGSTIGVYSLFAKMGTYSISQLKVPQLMPGVDTLIKIPLSVLHFTKEDQYRLQIQVSDSTGLIKAVPVEINRRYTTRKYHASAFKQFPLSVEEGIFLVEKKVYHFTEARMLFALKEGNLSFLYRTRTFGQLKTIERNSFLIELEKSKVSVGFGQLSEAIHFFAYGNGGRISFRPTPKVEMGFRGIIHREAQVYTNNNFQFTIRHQHRGLTYMHQFHLNPDRIKGVNSYLLYNELIWQKKEVANLRFFWGAGWEDFKKIPVFHSGDLGLGIGGLVNSRFKKWEFNGEIRVYQKSYPGLNKGFRLHQYELRRSKLNRSMGLFYLYNHNASPLLLDTIYISDAFTFNIEKAGVRLGSNRSVNSRTFSAGWLRQTGQTVSQVPSYLFGEGFYSWRTKSKFNIQFSTISGYAANKTVDRKVWLTNTSFDLRKEKFGIRGFYVQVPLLRDSLTKIFIRYNQTLLLSPYVNLNFFNKIRTVIRYSFSKSLYDKREIHGFGFSLYYRNGRGDWQVQCNGSIPISATKINRIVAASYPFVSLSIRKELKLPYLFKRRYYNLKVNAFEDLNGNNMLDLGENRIPQLRYKVNQSRFLTDYNGSFQLQNADTGNYSIALEPSPLATGLVPSTITQVIHLDHSKEVFLPLRKGHAISGKVTIELDPYSTRKFTPDNILINILDKEGKKYTTITDSSGRFYLPLPSGNYKVYLNEEAFSGVLRPVQSSFEIDLQSETLGKVEFILREKKREIRYRSN